MPKKNKTVINKFYSFTVVEADATADLVEVEDEVSPGLSFTEEELRLLHGVAQYVGGNDLAYGILKKFDDDGRFGDDDWDELKWVGNELGHFEVR